MSATDDDDTGDLLLGALLDGVDEASPSSSLKAELLLAVGGPWWAPFARATARLVGLSDSAARALLSTVDDEGRYLPAGDGMRLYHVDQRGPCATDAIVGFVRLQPGARFPNHSHIGQETVITRLGDER